MTDSQSPIIKYYPEEFTKDPKPNGKQYEEFVVRLPFVDEKLLLDALAPVHFYLRSAILVLAVVLYP